MSLLRGAWCELVLRANNKASIERNVHLAEARGSTAGDLRNAELAELGLELGELLEERLARAGAEFVCLDCGRPPKNRKKGHVASGVSARRSNWEGRVDGGAGRAARGVPDMVVTAAGSKGKRRRSRVPRPQELAPPAALASSSAVCLSSPALGTRTQPVPRFRSCGLGGMHAPDLLFFSRPVQCSLVPLASGLAA